MLLCMQVREQFPIQLFMGGSSGNTLELELARFARNHVQGLQADAEQDQLVQAARRSMAEHAGSMLLVVDDVVDSQAVLQLLCCSCCQQMQSQASQWRTC